MMGREEKTKRIPSTSRIFEFPVCDALAAQAFISFARPKETNQRKAAGSISEAKKWRKIPKTGKRASLERARFFTEFSTIFLYASPKRPVVCVVWIGGFSPYFASYPITFVLLLLYYYFYPITLVLLLLYYHSHLIAFTQPLSSNHSIQL
jgi:hypothetical protein